MASLLETFPDIAAQWDYERNEGQTPADVTYGSNKIVWWKCPLCGHSYQKKIANITSPAKRKTESGKCPICLGRVIIPGFNSLKAKFPEIIEKEWDFEKNTIDPDTIPPTYRKKMWWICPTNPNHKWNGTVASVSNGFGCKECSGWGYRYTTEEWIAEAKKVHGDKYQYHLVRYVDSETKVDIVCPKHGVFRQVPYYHLHGQGCPCCAHQKFHFSESLAALHPDIASEWDYELNANTGYTPYNIGIDTRKKFYWHCNNGYSHSYLATIAFRCRRNSGCAICHGKQVSPDTSLAMLNPALAAEWCAENDKTPSEVTLKSDYEALWKCPNPNHPPYRQKVEVRSRGVGCVFCHGGKKHPKDFEEEVRQLYPYITIIQPFEKSSIKISCKCNRCGHIWHPYPYGLLKSKGCPKCRGI